MSASISSLLSLLGPLLTQFGGGKEGQMQSTYSPQQQSSQNQFLGGLDYGNQDITQNQNYQTGQDYLQSMFSDPNFFNKFEAPLQRQFNEDTIPGLANQFAGMGSGGSFGTGFQNAAAREGRNLQQSIAALRGNMQQQAVPQLLGYAQQPTSNFMQQYGLGQQNQQNNIYRPATPGPLGEIGGALTGSTSGIWGDVLSGLFNGKGGASQPQAAPTVGLGQNTGMAARGAQTGAFPWA